MVDLASENLVSLTITTDPFCTVGPSQLSAIFPDRVIHFKDHHVNDLDRNGSDAVSIAGRREGRPLGFHIWFVQGDVAHSHLLALTEEGYDLRAGYALMLKAIERLTGKMSLLNNAGGGRPDDDGGLTHLKTRWSSTVHPSYPYRKIFDHAAHRTLTDPEIYKSCWQRRTFRGRRLLSLRDTVLAPSI